MKFSLSRHFEYANEQITYHFWLSLFLRNSRRKSGVGKMNGTVITNRLQNSFKIKDNNVYGDHCIIEILGLRPSNRLPVSYYFIQHLVQHKVVVQLSLSLSNLI